LDPLTFAVPLEYLDESRRELKPAACPRVLQLGEGESRLATTGVGPIRQLVHLDTLQPAANENGCSLEIHVVPRDAERFAAPEPECEGQDESCLQPVGRCGAE